jgi:predicted RNase H-related nuclease YkuK (DUF458 family)
MIFRHGTTSKPIASVSTYVLEQLALRPDTKIYIGIDSKVRGDTCRYALVIAFRYGNNGVHYIFNKDITTPPATKWQRLMEEIERLMNFVSWFKDHIPVEIYAVDIDVNSDERFYSYKLHALATGWASSLGVRVITKPDLVVASRAADYLVNQ